MTGAACPSLHPAEEFFLDPTAPVVDQWASGRLGPAVGEDEGRMGGDTGFAAFAAREVPRLELLVGSLAAPRQTSEVVVGTWLVARHHWPVLQQRPRPDLWLFALALRMLRRSSADPAPSTPSADPPAVGLQALDPAVRPAAVLGRLLGLGTEEAAVVLDLPVERVRAQLCDVDRVLDRRVASSGSEAPLDGAPCAVRDLGPAAVRPGDAGTVVAALDTEYRRWRADPARAAELDGHTEAAVAYLGAEEALRRDDLPAAATGFAVAAAAGFGDATRRSAVVRGTLRTLRTVGTGERGAPNYDELAVAATAGDERAMRVLLDSITPMILRYCRARATVLRDGATSPEDIAQEAVLAVIAALPTWVPGSRPFVAWVMRVTSNKVYDAHRAATRLRLDWTAEVMDGVDPAPGPAERVERLDDVAAARLLLGGLTDRQREVLVMRVVCQMTAEEVAAVLGTSPGAVRVAQHRALQTLRSRKGARRGSVTPIGGVAICGESA